MPTNRLTKLFNDGITVEEHGDFYLVDGVYYHKTHPLTVEPRAAIQFCDDCGDCEATSEFASFIDGFNYRGREDLIIGGVLGALAFALFISLCRL